MLKTLITNKFPALLLTTLTSILPLTSASAVTFDETEVDQNQFIAVAQPFGENKYNLIVIEQIPGQNNCWSEIPETSKPVNVNLLLMDFDFSGHCRRSTDANGYSIRYQSQDLGLDFLLTLVERDGELLLLGNNRRDPSQPTIVVGSAEGINGQPMKIKLNSGWRFSKRTYEGKILGHVYFSYDPSTPSQNNEGISPETEEMKLENEEIKSENDQLEMFSQLNQKTADLKYQKQIKKNLKNTPITKKMELELINNKIELR
jgi:Protein of unknown function (DUF3747)